MAKPPLQVADERLAQAVRECVLAGFRPRFGERRGAFAPHPVWRAAAQARSELWLDTGDLDAAADLWCAEFSGLTTNNTLLNKEVQKGLYDGFVGEVARIVRQHAPAADEGLLVREIAFALNARHGLTLVERFDAHVSVELHTDLADDIEASVHYARRYWSICPERFYVKLPLTPAGLLATRRLAREGVLVNLTLGFSARQNDLAVRVAGPAFVNVFLGRINSLAADQGLGSGAHTGQKALAASFERVRSLRETAGAPTRQIAASIRNGAQVWDLAGCDVLTIPVSAAREVAGGTVPGQVGQPLRDGFPPDVDEEALGVFEPLWSIDEHHAAFAHALAAADLDEMTPARLATFARTHGARDLFPAWRPADVARVDADGKIPRYAAWERRLKAGTVGLDALFNLSALRSFAADQRVMDERIRTVLGA